MDEFLLLRWSGDWTTPIWIPRQPRAPARGVGSFGAMLSSFCLELPRRAAQRHLSTSPRCLSRPQGTRDDTGFHNVPHSWIRAAIATRLTESTRIVPHFYVRGTCRVDRLLALRSELNANAEQVGRIKLSTNDLVVKAAARAHTVVPGMNVIWTEHAIRRFDTVDVGVVMASERGLVTPVVRDVARRSAISVSADLRDFADRAQKGKLARRESDGGAFCISNLGMYGTRNFSAVINPPQTAILAVGAAISEPVVQDGELAVGTVIRVTLSVDHRPIDGSTAAEWMQAFVGIIENSFQILVRTDRFPVTGLAGRHSVTGSALTVLTERSRRQGPVGSP